MTPESDRKFQSEYQVEGTGPLDEPNELCQYRSTIDGKYYNGVAFSPEYSRSFSHEIESAANRLESEMIELSKLVEVKYE